MVAAGSAALSVVCGMTLALPMCVHHECSAIIATSAQPRATIATIVTVVICAARLATTGAIVRPLAPEHVCSF